MVVMVVGLNNFDQNWSVNKIKASLMTFHQYVLNRNDSNTFTAVTLYLPRKMNMLSRENPGVIVRPSRLNNIGKYNAFAKELNLKSQYLET